MNITGLKLFRSLRVLVGAGGVAAGCALTGSLAAADMPADAAPAAPAATVAAAPSGATFVFSPPKEGVVLPGPLREKMLAAAKALLERDNPSLLAKLKGVDNPFYLKLEAPVEPVAPTPGTTSTQPVTQPQFVPPAKLTDEEKLKLIAAQFKPTGVLDGAGHQVVLSAFGQIEVGGSFTVGNFPNDNTKAEIHLVGAGADSCTLKLNNTTLDVDYISTSGSSPGPNPPGPSPSPASSTLKP